MSKRKRKSHPFRQRGSKSVNPNGNEGAVSAEQQTPPEESTVTAAPFAGGEANASQRTPEDFPTLNQSAADPVAPCEPWQQNAGSLSGLQPETEPEQTQNGDQTKMDQETSSTNQDHEEEVAKDQKEEVAHCTGCARWAQKKKRRTFQSFLVDYVGKEASERSLALRVSKKELQDQSDQWDEEQKKIQKRELENKSILQSLDEEISKLRLDLDQAQREQEETDRQLEEELLRENESEAQSNSFIQSLKQELSKHQPSLEDSQQELQAQREQCAEEEEALWKEKQLKSVRLQQQQESFSRKRAEVENSIRTKDQHLTRKHNFLEEHRTTVLQTEAPLKMAEEKLQTRADQCSQLVEEKAKVLRVEEREGAHRLNVSLAREKQSQLERILDQLEEEMKAKDLEMEEETSVYIMTISPLNTTLAEIQEVLDMDSGGWDGDNVSPESTVTTLLSSSGHLKSSLQPPAYSATFRYRDTDFDSASEALDAYIADFEKSRQKCSSLSGSLVLPHGTLPAQRRPFARTLRNKDVLRERLTERELDFLTLPVSSLRHRSNRDRASMTTDELLSIPNDGSQPVTHTSAFIQALLSGSGSSQSIQSSCSSSSSDPKSLHPNHRHPLSSSPPWSSRNRRRPGKVKGQTGTDAFKRSNRAVTSQRAEASSSLHHWIQHCDLSKRPPTIQRVISAPSWLAELEQEEEEEEEEQQQEEEEEHTVSKVESALTLRDLRLQFAEQISQRSAEAPGCDIMANLCRDNKIESLIQKADRVLTTLSRGSGGEPANSAQPASPVNTEDLLLRSPSPSVGSTGGEFSETNPYGLLMEPVGGSPDGSGRWKQPGPVEAFKQMLFRLQAVETQLQQQEPSPPPPSSSPPPPSSPPSPSSPVKQRFNESDVQSFPASPSLQRALHHLSRLKLLVVASGEKSRVEEEKDEDEGRYSASSADRPDSSQQEAC